jgi:membrane protease YdiL (CAAX protease family)
MNEAAPVLNPPRDTWLERIQAALEVLLVSGLVSSFFAAIPFSVGRTQDALLHDARLVAAFILAEATLTLFFIFVLLRVHRETLASFGLQSRQWLSHSIAGVLVIPLLLLTNIAVAEIFRRYLPAYYLERNPLIDLIRTPGDFVLFLFSALLAGGIKEELQRAFILNRFRQHLGGVWLGLILWSLAFAAGHYIQGIQGVVVAGILGVIFGILYIARNSIIAPMVSHALYDTMVLSGYWLFLRSS